MVNPQARAKARRILKDVALGKVSNFEAENRFMDIANGNRDGVIFALFRTLRESSGDREESLSSVFAKGTPMRKRLCRWVFFLQSGLEYQWPKARLAPGLRDLYRPTWLDKLLGELSPAVRENREFCEHGDYHVWPFLREAEFASARAACGARTNPPVSRQMV